MDQMTILWGVRKGQPDWAEEIITTNAAQIDAAKRWAISNGFDRFRVSKDDGSPPDFAGTIAKRQKRGE